MQNKLFFVFALAFALNFAPLGFQVYGQEQKAEKFTNLGAIAISDKYTLPENRRAIVFRIRNNTTRSISQIFGKVYKINKSTTDPKKKFLLINNPHRGANTLKGSPHLPGTIAEWNFVLAVKPRLADQNLSYTLQVHPRSIFFSNVEPMRKAKEKP
ncbi:hypothetical protein JYT29_03370 [Nitrospina gracilis]|nr:hypothetical protein [Nitrospina gracilis]